MCLIKWSGFEDLEDFFTWEPLVLRMHQIWCGVLKASNLERRLVAKAKKFLKMR